MSTTRKIAHNTGIQIVGKILSTGLGLVALRMMTEYLGTEKFGWYVTSITFLQFVGILIDFGFIPVSAQMLSEPDVDRERLMKNLLGFRVATAAFFLGVAPSIALLFPYPFEVKIAIAFSSISFFAVAVAQVFWGYYQSTLRMYFQVAADLTSRIALVLGLSFCMARGFTFLPIMVVVALAGILSTLVMIWGVRHDGVLGLAYETVIWKQIWHRAWPIAVAIIFNVAYLRGDTILLSLYRSQEEVGIYGAAYRVIDVLSQTAMMLMGIFLPLLAAAWSRKLTDEFRIRYQQAFDMMMFFAVPLVFGGIYLATPIMRLVASDKFVASGPVLQILMLAIGGVFLGGIFGHTAVAIGKQKISLWVYATNALLTVPAYLCVIPRYGMTGAAWVTVFSEIYAGLLLWAVVRVGSRQRLEFRTFFKVLASGGLMLIVLSLLPALHVLAQVAIGGAVYLAILLGTRAISRETLRDILHV